MPQRFGPSTLGEAVEARVENAIRSKFDLDTASKIEMKPIEVDQRDRKVRIEILITTKESPKALAEAYFGLTGKVREALGSDWSGFFPVITPKINTSAPRLSPLK